MDIPWAYFDDDSQWNPPIGGSRRIVYLFSNHNTTFKAGIGQETNNYFELMVLKLTLQLAQEYGVTQLRIFHPF
jgi:ribonuclease HI